MILAPLLPEMFARYLRLFWGYAGRRLLAIVGLTIIVSNVEGLGIALFFPLFAGAGGASDGVSRTLTRVFHALHIPLTPRGALPILAALFLLKGLLFFVLQSYQFFTGTRVTRRLRQRLIDALSRVEYTYFARSNTGQRTNLVVNEIPRAASGFLAFIHALPPGVNAGIFFVIVLLLDWQLTLACFGMGLVLVLLLRYSGRIARSYSEQTSAENSRLAAFLIEALQAFKYLRATAGFGQFQRRIDASADRLAHADYRSSAAIAFTQSALQPLAVLFLAVVLYYRSVIQQRDLSPLFVVMAYFFRIMSEVFLLQSFWQQFCSFTGSVDAVEAAIEEGGANREPHGERPFAGLTSQIRCVDLYFSYSPDRPTLEAVNVRIPRYSTVAFVGESGSGKSTLMDLISGTLRPTAGKVLFDDEELGALDLDQVRRRIGFVPQDSAVFDDTVANNIALWGDVPRARIVEAARRSNALDFIEQMTGGFDAAIGDRGVNLSGGQRQRLAIARELLKEPDLLILDEATSALDSESEQAIKRSIDGLKGKMTILLIAHRLSTIRNCDRVYVLHEGRIVEEGAYDELLARPGSRFRRMCELQNLTDVVGGR